VRGDGFLEGKAHRWGVCCVARCSSALGLAWTTTSLIRFRVGPGHRSWGVAVVISGSAAARAAGAVVLDSNALRLGVGGVWIHEVPSTGDKDLMHGCQTGPKHPIVHVK
jgi:hypothetical protein